VVDAAICEANLDASTRVDAIVSGGRGDERKTARETGKNCGEKDFSEWTALDEERGREKERRERG
jgi:hypothetical protein